MNCYTMHMFPDTPSTWDLDRLEGDNGLPLGIDLYSEDESIFFYWDRISPDTMRIGALYQTPMDTFFISDVIASNDSTYKVARDIVAETIKFLRKNSIYFRPKQDLNNFPRTVYEQAKFSYYSNILKSN